MRHLLDTVYKSISSNLLVTVTLCYLTGATLAKYVHIGHPFLKPFMVSIIASYVILLFFQQRKFPSYMLLPLFVFTGLVHTSHSLTPPQERNHLYNLLPEKARVTLTGRVLNMPEHDGQKTRFDLAADSILFHSDGPGTAQQKTARGKIRLSLDGQLHSEILPGSQVMILASAGRTYNYQTPGVFDYKLYLANKSIFVSGKIQSPLDIIPFQDLDQSRIASLASAPEQWRHKISTFLENRLDPSTAGIYKALLIGSRSTIDDTVLEQFKATGCMHLLAISGIHMSLLGLIITLSMIWIMKRSTWLLLNTHIPTIATLFSIFPLILYACIAGLNTPVLRSLLMSCFFLIGIVLQRQRSIVHIIAAAALLLLIWKPLALFTVSFQLSFASIMAIALVYPQLLRRFEQKNAKKESKTGMYISSALLVSVTASLGALPFMLFHFNRFSLIGPFMNLLVEPFLCLWALPLGLLAIPFVFIAPEVATTFLKFGSLGIMAADRITLTGSKLPFASFGTITPTILEICFYYFLLLLLIYSKETPRRKLFCVFCFLILAFSFTHGLFISFPSETARVSFLDVGQGSSTLLQLPNDRTILIDGGSKTSPSFNIGERVIDPYLRKMRIWKLDDIIITHPDSDHANGVNHVLGHFKPERLWVNNDTDSSWHYRETIEQAVKLGIKVIKPITGETIEINPETSLTFIQGANAEQTFRSVNDRSLVIRVDHRDISFLFPGDISKRVERNLVRKGSTLDADILLAPHHGSKGSGSREFIDKVDPEIIVVSAGRSSSRRYLSPQHLATWRDDGRTVLSTAVSGTINCRSDGAKIIISTFSDDQNIGK